MYCNTGNKQKYFQRWLNVLEVTRLEVYRSCVATVKGVILKLQISQSIQKIN